MGRTGGGEGEETVTRTYYVRKKSIFIKRKKNHKKTVQFGAVNIF